MTTPTVRLPENRGSSWIDRQCDQFERDWRAGKNPRIEDILAGLPTETHEAVLRELLGIEIELRRRSGEKLARNEYQERFPAAEKMLDEFEGSFSIHLDATQPLNGPSGISDSATTSARYRDLRFFRKGGLGALYRAVDDSLHRETVVKFMNDDNQDPSLVAQFRVEAEVTSRLDHPGVVPVYGIGQDWHGRPFYVMRLINGRELKEAIRDYHEAGGPANRGAEGRQQLFTLLEHLVSTCNTVAYAHHVGIIHCDLKPANIMIGKYGETFVLDWGLATSFERTPTFRASNEHTMRPHGSSSGSNSGQRGGTYGYISPEQLAADGPIGPASDVYSLGATLYEILVGRPPFDGHDVDVAAQIRGGRLQSPRSVQRRIPRGLEAICLKALSLSPSARYATAKHLAADVTNWMRDEEVQALPDRWHHRLARFARRHRNLTAAAVAIVLTVLVAGGLTDRTLRMAANEKALREKAEELRALEEKTRAGEQLSLTTALDTFENLCRPLANGEMNNLGVFRPFVDQIETFTAQYLDDFEHVESMRKHTARVYELRATVKRVYSSDLSQAIEDYQRAEKLLTELPPDEGESYDRALRLARIHLSQGRLYLRNEDYDLAARALTAAADGLEKLRQQHPTDTLILRQLAEAYHGLGEVFLNREEQRAARHRALLDAEGYFEKSKQLRERLIGQTAGEDRRQHERDLARSQGYLGDLYLAQGNVGQSVAAYEKSRSLREALYRSNPLDPEHRFQYGRGLANFGFLERDYRGNLTSAIEQMLKAQGIQQELADGYKDVENFKLDLSTTLNLLAELYLLAAQAHPEQANEYRQACRKAAEQAGKLYSDIYQGRAKPADTDGLGGLAQSYITLSALEQSSNPTESLRLAKEAERLVEQFGLELVLPRGELVTLAFARSLQNRPADAFRALSLAVERGENTVQRFELHATAGLKAIADDPEQGPKFQALIKQMKGELKFD